MNRTPPTRRIDIMSCYLGNATMAAIGSSPCYPGDSWPYIGHQSDIIPTYHEGNEENHGGVTSSMMAAQRRPELNPSPHAVTTTSCPRKQPPQRRNNVKGSHAANERQYSYLPATTTSTQARLTIDR